MKKFYNFSMILLIFFTVKTIAKVELRDSLVQWKTYKHTVNQDYSLKNDTFSTEIVTNTYRALVMENKFLRVTIVPEYGGRILSIIYKPSGMEQLYQNPVGRPYGPEWDAFYYDWLMVWGGIFPTFSEPEHGKAWCRPWTYEITKNSDEEVAIKMMFKDTINFSKHPSKFKYGPTNIICYFEVYLKDNSSALKTSVTLVNTENREIDYEYWTNVGVAPGSSPGNTLCDEEAEIIGKINNVKISSTWSDLQKVENKISEEMYHFEKLRWYKNWTNEGILYGWPVESNFWGALNHKNNEAIIRISDNSKTPGLKIWTFGYNQSKGFNPEKDINYRRPFIEMWAGVSKEFFTPAKLAPKATLQFDEYYIITKGLTSFTYANEYGGVDLTTDKKSYNGKIDSTVVINCKYFVTEPKESTTFILYFKDTKGNKIKIADGVIKKDSCGPFETNKKVALKELCDDISAVIFEIRRSEEILINTESQISISNVGNCNISSTREKIIKEKIFSSKNAKDLKIYSINGKYFGEGAKLNYISKRKFGVFITVDKDKKQTCLILIH